MQLFGGSFRGDYGIISAAIWITDKKYLTQIESLSVTLLVQIEVDIDLQLF